MEAEQARRQQLQVQALAVVELDIDVPQMENEETGCNAASTPSSEPECSNQKELDSKTQDFENAKTQDFDKDGFEVMADECCVVESTGNSMPVEYQGIGMDSGNADAGVPENSAAEVRLQACKPETALISCGIDSDMCLNESIENDEHELSENRVSPFDIVQDKISEVKAFACSTTDGTSDVSTIEMMGYCDSEKNELDTACEHSAPYAAQAENPDNNEEAQCEVMGYNAGQVEILTEEDIANNEHESEKVLIEASKKCVSDFVQRSSTVMDEVFDERQIEEINSMAIDAESNLDQCTSNLSNNIQSDSQETCIVPLADGAEAIQDNISEPEFESVDNGLPSEVVIQINTCSGHAAEL
jgi:hypothetical protein